MRGWLYVGCLIGLAWALLCGRAAFGNPAFQKKETIIFLGDSITWFGAGPEGYITFMSQAIETTHAGAGIELIGAGVRGNKVPDCLRRLEADVLQKSPTIVVIYIGINDVWHWDSSHGTTKEAFDAGLRDMIAKIQAAGARVILCTPTVIGEKSDGTNRHDKMLDEYSDLSRTVAQETGAQLLDLRNAFLAYLKDHNPSNAEQGILTRDAVHLNRNGNLFLSTLMLDALNVLPRP